jgi:hypothetical protein
LGIQRNPCWPLNGPSFSSCLDSIVVLLPGARKTVVGFGSNFAVRMASRLSEQMRVPRICRDSAESYTLSCGWRGAGQAGHNQRLRLYFDMYGCLRCLQKDVIYGGNGFCFRCLHGIEKPLKKVDEELRARLPDSPPDPNEAYLPPYNFARKLLADLVIKSGNSSKKRKPEPKSPPQIYPKLI